MQYGYNSTVSQHIKTAPCNDELSDTVADIAWKPEYAQQMQNSQQRSFVQSNVFAAATWNGEIRLYQVQPIGNQLQIAFQLKTQIPEPVISICWHDSEHMIFFATAAGHCGFFNYLNNVVCSVDENPSPAFRVCFQGGVLVTFSYDGIVRVYQEVRNTQGIAYNKVNQKRLKYTPIQADWQDGLVGVVFENFKVFFADPQELFTSTTTASYDNEQLYYNAPTGAGSVITSFAIQPLVKTYNSSRWRVAFGTAESRCNFSNVEKISGTSRFKLDTQVTFKCEKSDNDNAVQTYYPVTQLAFNVRESVFLLTGGSYGSITFWDMEKKNKVNESFFFNKTPVSACKIDPSGHFLVYALGYDWFAGVDYVSEFPSPQLYLYQIGTQDLKKK